MAKFWIDGVIDNCLTPVYRYFILALGPILCISLYGLVGLHVYAYLGWITKLQQKRLGTTFAMVWQSIGLILLYNVVYNHFLAMIIKPGGPKEQRLIENLRKIYKNRTNRKSVQNQLDDKSSDRFEGLSKEVKQLLRFRQKTMDDITFAQKRCKRCNDIKPARTHHCTVCDNCVFMMDHHCPWINNCVGKENLRYFLLFVFYLWIALCYMLISFAAIRHHHVFKEQDELFTFLVILDGVLALIMFAFTVWNWYLAFVGYSTIEFWGSMMQEAEPNKVKFEYGFKTVYDNLYKTFGTNKIFRVFSPSMRNVPFTGLEWAFQLHDEGFDRSGVKLLTDIEMRNLNNEESLADQISQLDPAEQQEFQLVSSQFQ